MKKKVKILVVDLIILVFAIALLLGKELTSRMIASFQGKDNKAQYKEITEEDYKTQSDNVKFMAYFVNGDKQVDGTNNRIGYNDTLYFNLKVYSGTLKNAKIKIDSQNFYLETNLMEDSVISSDYVSANTKEIALKEISGNVDKTITGSVKSGNYEFPTSKAEAIGEDISNYSKNNTIVFSADYIDENNNTTTITKEIPITVTWYGSINIEIPNQVYGNDNLNQKYNISNYLDEENEEMTLEFKVAVQETTNEVLIKKSYVEGKIPLINDIAPTNVVIEGENVNYTYDPDTQKFTANREAVLLDNTISEEAYSGIYAQNEIQYRYNEYTIKATYPIDAYLVDDDEYIDISVPVSGYYEGFNGEKSEQKSANISVAYSNMDNTTTGFRAFIGRNVLYPVERQIVSKRNILLAYRYYNNQSTTPIESEYYTRWNIVTRLGEQVDKAVLTDNNTKDVFINSTGAEITNNDYIYNKGIAFSNPISALGEDGWIEVYNDETDQLIHKFTIEDWSNYDTLNPYEYDENVNYIRVETSTVAENSMLTVYNVKGFNIDKIKQDFTQEELQNITQIKTDFKGTMQIAGETIEYSTEENAYFEDETSVVNFSTSKSEINTQKSNYLQIEINPNISQYNTSTWTDEQYLVKLPEDIINLTINDITTDNQENVRIKNYYQYKDNGNIFIKIEMEGEGFSSYRLLLDCIVETNPTVESKTPDVELYAYNAENNNYYTTDQSEDIYDINNNNNTQEKIGRKTDTISIVQEDTLLTYQSTSDATPENETIYAPLTAIVENENRTATIDITLQNNKETPISDVKVLGTMPFVGNKCQLTGEDLGSTYNAELVSDGIILPDELARYATVYYSTNVDVNDDTTDLSNNWTLAPDSYSNVKHFLIVFNRYEIESEETIKVSYRIRIPEQIEYNEISYSAHTVYYSENTETQDTRKTVEVNKLGFMLTKRVNLNISTISKDDNSGVEGATFKLIEKGTRGTTTLKETNTEGQVIFEQLFLERDYTLEQIGVSDDYVRNQDVISFRAYEEDGQIKLNITNGNMDYTIDQNTKTVQVTINNEVRYDFELTNLSTIGEAIQSTFTLTGNGQNFTQETSQDGKTVFTGLYPEQEYTLTQDYSKGYYIEDNSSVTFKLTRTNSGLELQTISGNFANSGSIDDTVAIKPVLRQTIQNEAIPTFNLKVTLYESGKIIPLESAQYRISGGGIENGVLYTTDARGTFTVPDLYIHVDGKNVTGEYTLKEIEPTVGYALAQTDIKLIVSKNPNTQELTLNVTNGNIREEYEIIDNTVSIGIENSIIFNITSRDGETVELLPGVKLVIKELVIENEQEVERDPMDADGNILGETQIINGESCQVFTTNENGVIEEALRNGIYKIVKIEVPYGYHLEENEEDRTYYVGIGETRGADVEAQFRDPLKLSGSGNSNPDDYYVAGRDDGMGLFYHRGSLSLINDDNEVVRTISSNQALQIIDDNGTFVVLEDSRIVKYNDNLDAIATINITSGMEKFAATTDGGYVVVGNYSGTKTINGNLTSNGQSLSISSTYGYDEGYFQTNTVDIFVVKVDANGKVSNLAGFGGAGAWRQPGEDRATYVTVDNNGDFVISAHIESEEISGNMMANGSDVSGTFDDCYFVMDSDTMKVSQIITVGTTRGNVEATAGNAHRAFAGIDGGVYYVGQMSGTVTFSGSQTASGQAITVTSTGDTDAYAVKFNSEGKVVWATAVGGPKTDHIYSAEYTLDGELLIGGDSDGGAITVDGSKTSSGISINTEPIGENASTWRGITIKIDSQGRVVWANEFGYATNEGIYTFAGFTGNSYVIGGFNDADNNINNGREDVYIRVDEAEHRQEISEVKGIEITTNKEKYNITTSVNGVGGTITGQDQAIFETIAHGENATKTITVTPDEGYEILAIRVNGEKIPFTTNTDGTATVSPLQNITENTNIVAEFSNNTSKIIVHHYLLGTETKVAEDDVFVGIVGDEYTTSPKADLIGYELAVVDGEYAIDGEPYGTYGEYDKEIIYYYQEKTARLIVNYFIEGTNTPLSPSLSYEVEKGESYNTEEPVYIPEEYELVAQPSNKSGIIEESEIVVTYYYRLKPTYEYKIEYYYDGVIDDALTQTGEAIENKVIDTYEPQLKEGYLFDHTEGLPLTISTNTHNNIIKVYYKAREDLRYTVEYYYDGIKEDSVTYTDIKFGTTITEYENKVKEGYQLEKVEGIPLTIGINEQNNIIKVYYTIRKDLYYTVHYYEENSTIKAAPDKEVGGNTYHSVITESPIDIEGYTKVSNDPQNITIQVDESQNVITFYYIKHAQIPQNQLIKTGPDVITKENEILEYTITYTGVISGYKGNATLTLVDYLPYQIDTNTAELDGGTYNSAEKTITWVETLEDIDTNTNGDLPVNITKTIRVAYTNIDYSNTTITNRVSGNISLARTGQEIEIPEVTKNTTTQFTKEVTVTKIWNHTNNIYGIPTQVEIQVKNGEEVADSHILNESNKVEENTWTYTFTGLQKYNEQGREINYTIDEVGIGEGELKYYSKNIQGNTITNTYIGPVISATKEANTENGLNYVVENERITYIITVKNDGQIAKDVIVADKISEGTTLVDKITINDEETEHTQEELDNGITVNVPAKEEITVSFVVTVNELEGGLLTKQLSNTAYVDGVAVGPVTNTVNKSDLKFWKEAQPQKQSDVKVGDIITYSIKLDNSQGTAPTTAVVEDTIPQETTYVENSIKINNVETGYTKEELKNGISIDLADHETKILTFQVTVNDLENGYTISNTATVNDTDTEAVTHRYVEPIISGNKVVTTQNNLNYVVEGETVTYTITVENKGFLAGKATIKDQIPDGTTFVENSVKVNNEETTNTAENLRNGIEVDVPAQGSTTLSFEVTVNTLEDGLFTKEITNIAKINEIDTNPVTNIVNKPNVIPSKEVSPLPGTDVKEGDIITYTIKLDNSQGTAPDTVVVKDTIPTDTTFEGNMTLDGSPIDNTESDLKNGISVPISEHQIRTLSFQVKVGKMKNGEYITNIATVDGKETEQVTNRYVEPIISAKKESSIENDRDYVLEGEIITYTITLTNKGYTQGTALVKDIIPEGTSFVNGSVKENGSIKTYTEEDLKNGVEITVPAGAESAPAQVTISFEVRVNTLEAKVFEREITNTANVNGTDTNKVTNIVNKPNVIPSKESENAGQDVELNDIITYTIKLDNSLGTAPDTVVVKDLAPIGTTFIPGTIKENNQETQYTEENLQNGINVNINAHETKTISFQVQVNEGKNASIISNTAEVNNIDTNPITHRYVEPIITATKYVTTQNKLNYVVEGETITYTVTVRNTGFAEGTATIMDTIPDGTTFIPGSVKINGVANDTYTEENLRNGIRVTVPAGEETDSGVNPGTTTLSFEVTVKNLAQGVFDRKITNTATVNNVATNQVENTVNKPNVIPSKTADPADGTDVKQGDVITYYITLDNTLGTAPDTVLVKDDIPTGTSFVEGSIKENNVVLSESGSDNLANGINVSLAPHEKKVISFQVKVKDSEDTANIENTASVDGTNTEPVTHRYVKPIISAKKNSTTENKLSYVVEGEKITYTITIQNTGHFAGRTTVKDTIPEGTIFVPNSIKVNNSETQYSEDDLRAGIQVDVTALGQTTLSFDVTVDTLKDGNLVKTLSNTATVNNAEVGPVTNIVNKSDLKFWKEAIPVANSDVKEGDIITYTITLDNIKGTAPTTAVVEDTIPQGTTYVENSIKINNVETSYTKEELENGISIDLADHETKILSFQVKVNDSENGYTISNTATVNDTEIGAVTHRYVEPIISGNKAVTTQNNLNYVVEGETITYTITVENKGFLAGKATIKDQIPDGTTFVESSVKENNEETTYTAEDLRNGIEVDVPAQGSTTLSFKVTVNTLEDQVFTKQITNIAKINEIDTNPVTNTVNKPNVIPSKTADPTSGKDVKEQDIITYTITLDNGTGTAPTTVNVKDNVPEGTTFVTDSIILKDRTTRYTEEELANGINVDLSAYEVATLSFKVIVNDLENRDTISNIATINDVPTEPVTHRYVEPIITATKESETANSLDYVVEGEVITYSITVQNSGDLEGKATIKDHIPDGTSFEQGSIRINDEEKTDLTSLNLQNGIDVKVPALGETTLTFQVKVQTLPDGTFEKTISNTANVNNVDTNPTQETVNKPNVIPSKEASPAGTDVKAGDIITYTIRLDNTTGTAPETVVVKDEVPTETTFVGNMTLDGEPIDNTEEDLNNGISVNLSAFEERTISFQVRVNDIDNGTQIENTAKVNGKDTETVTNRYVEPIISSNKTATTEHNLDYVVEGEKITYYITVENSGYLAGNATIKDQIPDGATFVENSVKVNNEETEYTQDQLKEGIELNVPAEGKIILSFEVTVNPLEGNTLQKDITNTATVNGTQTQPVTQTVKKPNLIVTKQSITDNGEQVVEGDIITYLITLDNSTGLAPTKVTVKDEVPEGTTFVDGSIKVNDVDASYELDNLINGLEIPIGAGATRTLEFQVEVQDLNNGVQIKNTATVNDTSTNEVSNTYIEPIISATKEITTQYGLDYVVQGEKVGYTITINNEGDLAKNVVVKDTIPQGTELVEGSISINGEEQEYIAEDLSNGIQVEIPARNTVIVRFVVTVGQDIAEIINIANVDGEDTNKTQIPVVTFTKTAEVIRTTQEAIEAGRVTASDKIKYTITINNLGLEAVDNITVKDFIPEGTTLSNIGNDGITNGNQEIIWNINNLQAETNTNVSYEVTVNYDSLDTKEIKNVATVDGKETNEVVTTYQKPTIKQTSNIVKTGTEVITSVDDEITYRITYTATIDDFVGKGKVTIVDKLPFSVNVANDQLAGGTYDQITKTITWEEDLGNIDTYLNDEKQVNIVKDITVKYVYEDEEHLSGTITNNIQANLQLTQGDNIVLEDSKQSSCGTRVEIPAKVIVHHYIYDNETKEYTKVKIAEDEIINGIIGTEYVTSKADIRADYTCINETPENYQGTMTKTDIEVKYYYELKDTQIGSVINKEAQASRTDKIQVGTGQFNEDGTEIMETKLIPVLTTEDGKVTYKISYRIGAKDYKGKVTANIVDTLPYEIDVSKSDFGGGTYDSKTNTITWNEEREVDTFANGMYDETIEKVITVVYINQDVTKNIVNTVEGNMYIYYPTVHSTKPGEVRLSGKTQTSADVAQEYKVNRTVEKVWDDNDNLKQRRPSSVTVQLTANESTSYNGQELEKVVLNDANNWTYTFENLPKYTNQGYEIQYSVIETETNPGDLEYYEQAKVEEFTNVIRVTNKYKLMNINLDSSITKTGTEQVTSSSQEVNYNITYNAKVTNYIGEALITIVDILPYEIDENLSNLDGGTYDKESKTITWRETIDHINTYVNADYNVELSKNISVVYSNLDATQRKMINMAQGTIDLYETETTNTKSVAYETNMEIPGKVVVKYVDKDTGEEITSEEQDQEGNIIEKTYGYEIDGLAGDQYTTEQKEIYGYTYVENSNNTQGNMQEGTITVIYYYVRTDSQGVTVRYVDEKGNEIADTEIITGKVKDLYKTEQKEIPNYDFVRVEGQTEGELVEEVIEVTYIYKKIPAKVIVQYLEKDNTPEDNTDNIVLANEQIIEGYSGDSYTTRRVEVKNYQAVEPEPENADGTMTREDIYVTYYYERKPSGIITVKYVDIDTNEEILHKVETEDGKEEYESYREQMSGLCGLEYETEQKDIPYYNFVKDLKPENSKGVYTEEDIEVIYYYRKQTFNLSVEKLIDRITVNGEPHNLKEDLNQIDVVASKVQETDIVVTYKIVVRNPSEIEGTAKVIESIPDFFKKTDGTSKEWTENGKTLEAQVTLQPGETKELIVVLRWIKNSDNFGLQKNTVTLENITNPANFEESNTEDNKAIAEVLLSVKTGGTDTSIILGTVLVIMVGTLIITIYLKERKTK